MLLIFHCRFLFPIYPLICVSGAVALDALQKIFFRVLCLVKNIPHGVHYLDASLFIMVIAITISTLLGISRTFSLYKNYHAPLDLMMELNRFPAEGKISTNAVVNVCFGKDWYRYPSSFFLPNTNWNVRFIQSEFKGILPAPYSNAENATSVIHNHFNDQNKEEPSLYFDVNKCHFLLDLDVGRETDIEPLYARKRDKWKIVKSLPFLDVQRSSSYFRSFYIPFLTDQYVFYGNFSLLQANKSLKKSIGEFVAD